MQVNLALGDIRIEIWGVRIRIQRMSVDRKIRRLPLAQFNFYWFAKKLLRIQQSSVVSFLLKPYPGALDPLYLNPKDMFFYLDVNQIVFLDDFFGSE